MIRYLTVLLLFITTSMAAGETFQTDVSLFIEKSCLDCHDADTETGLNFEKIGEDLTLPETFRWWERIYDRIHRGEMPPASESPPDPKARRQALHLLAKQLQAASLNLQRVHGRVIPRRLTRREYGNTLHDLLLIRENVAGMLPAETDSGDFDTIAKLQSTSPLHIHRYLEAADQALDAAINLGPRPSFKTRDVDYLNSWYVNRWYDIPLDQGGKVIKKLDDAVALFVDLDYIMRTDFSGLKIHHAGRYRITVEAYAYQAKTPVTLKVILASETRGDAQLVGAFDLKPEQNRTVEITTIMRPGDYLYPSVADLDPHAGVYTAGDARNYDGEGIAIKSFRVTGPLHNEWPPPSTERLLSGVAVIKKKESALSTLLRGLQVTTNAQPAYEVKLSRKTDDHVREIIEQLAPLIFRRPVIEGELTPYLQLADSAINDDREFPEIVRLTLRSMLISPQFLYLDAEPGKLDDYALASRLSYFLWNSLPDDELFSLAKDGQLTKSDVLSQQVDRMLNHQKSERFIRDFLGQWLRLYEINATTPDEFLYPEFDDVLNQALTQETELFFAELIKEDLSVRYLIDSDFTFLNRRLAEHYGIRDISGQYFRRVALAPESPRGGVLTQASVLKVTANGTVTSPVTRGNYVLTTLLGTPPDPPLPNVGSISPDTRGTTTIKETLDAHRNVATCARCHRDIDPPGFALECFDPIGGYRTNYRTNNGTQFPFQSIIRARAYTQGPMVDGSGVMPDGRVFTGIQPFKELLLEQQDQVARHLISELIAYSTGAKIQFADREVVDAILERNREAGYPIRTLIHEIVQSRVFRNN